MSLWTLTNEKKQQLNDEARAKRAAMDKLRAQSAAQLYIDDLDRFISEYEVFEEEMAAEDGSVFGKKGPKKGGRKAGAGKKTKASSIHMDGPHLKTVRSTYIYICLYFNSSLA